MNSQIPYFENILGLVKKIYGLAKITIHWDRSIYRDYYRSTESGWSLLFIPLNAAISLYLSLRLELVAVAPVMQNRDSALPVWRQQSSISPTERGGIVQRWWNWAFVETSISFAGLMFLFHSFGKIFFSS